MRTAARRSAPEVKKGEKEQHTDPQQGEQAAKVIPEGPGGEGGSGTPQNGGAGEYLPAVEQGHGQNAEKRTCSTASAYTHTEIS